MRILIIRHGDPDYENDSLTDKGKKEAALLSDRLVHENIDNFYCSPLGRARETCDFTIKYLQRETQILMWLQEFAHLIDLPTGEKHLVWDLLPTFREQYPDLMDAERWLEVPFIKSSNVPEKYVELKNELDKLLAKHGYIREGKHYRAENANRDTIAFFCHFGVESMILSHLLNISPIALAHGFLAFTSSVTTLYTEERRKGVAIFRCCGYGDISHLYAKNETPSFSGRFCETFDSDERHD